MSVNKFGKSERKHRYTETQLGTSVYSVLSTDGNYDFHNKKLINISSPTNETDCANKMYIDEEIFGVQKELNSVKKEMNGKIEAVRLQLPSVEGEEFRESVNIKLDNLASKQLSLNNDILHMNTVLSNAVSTINQQSKKLYDEFTAHRNIINRKIENLDKKNKSR